MCRKWVILRALWQEKGGQKGGFWASKPEKRWVFRARKGFSARNRAICPYFQPSGNRVGILRAVRQMRMKDLRPHTSPSERKSKISNRFHRHVDDVLDGDGLARHDRFAVACRNVFEVGAPAGMQSFDPLNLRYWCHGERFVEPGPVGPAFAALQFRAHFALWPPSRNTAINQHVGRVQPSD